MSDFDLYGVRAEYTSGGPEFAMYRCPNCGRVAGCAYPLLKCRTGHQPVAMQVCSGEPETADSPDIDAYIP